MARNGNIIRRGAVYYALVHVPTDLQPAMGGKKQIWRSLETKDYAEAKRRKSPLLDQWVATFDDMRRRRDLTDDHVNVAIWDHYTTKLEEGDKERATRPTAANIEAATDKALAEARRSGAADAGGFAMINAMADVEILAGKSGWAARRRAARLNRLRSDLAAGDTRLIEIEADRFLAKEGFQIERGGTRYRELCHKLMRADIEQLERHAERDRGDFTGTPADPIVAEPVNRPDRIGQGGDRIMGLFGKYERENPNAIRAETFRQSRRDVQNFTDFVGPGVRASKIDKKMVREWKDLLADFPVKATETAIFKARSLVDIVAMNKALEKPKPTLTRNTIRRYMSSLGGFCRWLVKHDYLAANPVADMLPKKNGPANKRTTFTDGALTTLFGSPLFMGCKGEVWRDVDKPGDVVVRDHRFWIPLIMTFSGARPAEISQLHVADVRQEHGIWILHITEEGEGGKRTKTKGSMRVVPVHSELIRLGFLQHCEHMREADEKQIFPEIDIPETGQIAAQFSREFNRYLAKVGVKTDRAIVTYSLRHTFMDRARRAGFLDDEIGLVAGHEKPTMTGRYGIEKEGTLRRRAEIIEAVKYPGLKLDRLYSASSRSEIPTQPNV